ncbi:MutS protein 2 [Schizosaccharomyces japonicus yFS275]|uniref:MutS protein 2 n=1 Tax=Schizosaccharomyces japonicus (strain yFS275 / FY16936) TaxID=402676 RepID=B6K1W3_SCHJY|nr:MutS protein 2 [Schizosaccharomyces japonicus yFS275]EEB07144.1 MutS protein 2 [Schizosaccharomyces japonicus yFS275]
MSRQNYNAEKSEEARIFAFYDTLEKDVNTLTLFDRGESYFALGQDAEFVANTAYHTTSVLKYYGVKKIPYCTMSYSLFPSFARQVLSTHAKRVHIWAPTGKKRELTLVKQASPGNLQSLEDELSNDTLNSVATEDSTSGILLAVTTRVRQDQRMVGVAFIDVSLRQIGVCEFVDSDSYANFESLLVQTGAREILLASAGAQTESQSSAAKMELNRLHNIGESAGALVTGVRMSDFSSRDVEVLLSRVLGKPVSHATTPELSLQLAMASCAALLKYVGPSLVGSMSSTTEEDEAEDSGEQEKETSRTFSFYEHNLEHYMRLDVPAVAALNLFPAAGGNNNKSMSLFGLLNHCRTAMGMRQLRRWLSQPLLDADAINTRLDLVEAFVEDAEVRQLLMDDDRLLRCIPDVPRLSRRLIRGTASLEDVVRVYQMALALPYFVDVLKESSSPKKDLLNQLYTQRIEGYAGDLAKLIELVNTTIDLKALDAHRYVIKAEFDEELMELRQQLDELRRSIYKEHERAGDDLGLDTEKKLHLEHHHIYGWCLRLTRTEAGCLRGKGSRYTELATQKNGVYFTTSRLHGFNTTYTDLHRSYTYHQNGLAREVVKIAATYYAPLEDVGNLLAHLDVIVSFAHASTIAPIPYVRPNVHCDVTAASVADAASIEENEEGVPDSTISETKFQSVPFRKILSRTPCTKLVLKASRHPCLEVQDDVNFIPNDVRLEHGKRQLLIITGPNMGGKSTYIRQVGVIVVMAQIGCFVPCESADLDIVDSVLARVGAGDSQLKGVSTFMAEMLETATILRSASPRSLIIVDELGRGTSTTDGFGLAWAIAEYIVKRIDCFCLFATHFHELTKMAETTPVVQNLHVTALVSEDNTKDISFLYQVCNGASDRSFGIHVAELAQFPQKIIQMARMKARELEETNTSNTENEGPEQKKARKEGMELINRVMRTWKARVSRDMPQDKMMEEFKKVLAEFQSEIDGNTWIQQERSISASPLL